MTSAANNDLKASRIAVSLALVGLGIYVAYSYADDPSLSGLGPSGNGMVLMAVGVVLGVRAVRSRLPIWAARTAVAVGVLIAVVAALLLRAAALTAPLFARARDVPSVADSAPSPQYAAAVDRAREVVRAAVLEQNLPGVSMAVGAGGAVVWAEGFGWRDVVTRAPVTPLTRFNIGTAASAVIAASAPLRLTSTGTDAAKEWSPEAIGEEGEDFPPLTVLRHALWEPLGLMSKEYPLPGDRATFYVPRSDDNPRSGRRLMYMRDLACCAGKLASYSTASDVARIGVATGESTNGALAGGTVMSLMTFGDRGVVVAVLSNIAHANTSALAAKIGDAFTKPPR